MAEVTEQHIATAVDNIKSAFADGFQLADLAVLVREVSTFAEVFSLTGEEKRELALQVAQRVLDETDIPWWPDKLRLPLVGEVGADALIMRVMPKLLDLVVDATKGKLPLNAPPSE